MKKEPHPTVLNHINQMAWNNAVVQSSSTIFSIRAKCLVLFVTITNSLAIAVAPINKSKSSIKYSMIKFFLLDLNHIL